MLYNNPKPFLVTGANGFVGTRLVELLCNEGVKVRALVRSEAKGATLKEMGAEPSIGELNDIASLRKAVEGVAGVFHIAALFNQVGIPESVFFEVNVEGTRRLLEAAIQAGVERFVHCSTNGVHGDVKNPPANESTPYSPCDEYQRSKVEGEKVALDYFRSGKINGVVIRPAMIYGPGDIRLFKIFKMIAKGRFFFVGSGDVWVHFIDVRDLARSFCLAMDKDNLNAEAYLIAGERPLKLKEMTALIANELGVTKPWFSVPLRPMQWAGTLCEILWKPFGKQPPLYKRRVDFFIKNRCFDISKAKRDLGFNPARSLEEEVHDIVQWYRKRGMLE